MGRDRECKRRRAGREKREPFLSSAGIVIGPPMLACGESWRFGGGGASTCQAAANHAEWRGCDPRVNWRAEGWGEEKEEGWRRKVED